MLTSIRQWLKAGIPYGESMGERIFISVLFGFTILILVSFALSFVIIPLILGRFR